MDNKESIKMAERIAVLEERSTQFKNQILELKQNQEKHEDKIDNDKSKKTTRNFTIISIAIAIISLVLGFLNFLNNLKP